MAGESLTGQPRRRRRRRCKAACRSSEAPARVLPGAGASHDWTRPRPPGRYGVIAMAVGPMPTLMALSAVLVAVLIGVTVPERLTM